MALTKVTYSMIQGASANVLDYGAVADGVTSNTVAFQAAINAVLTAGGGSVYIPQGVYFFPAGQKLDPGAGNIMFYGDGMDASVLYYNEGTTVPGFAGVDHLFRNVANVTKKNLQFQDLQFRGTLNETTRAGRWANPLFLDYYPTLTINSCKFLNIAAEAMDIHFCGYFKCVDNYFKNIAADGIRARDTSNCFVSGNYLEQLGDDAIALHTTNSVLPTRQGLIITNNRIVNGGAIKCLGGRVVQITNNQLELLNFWAINVETASGVDPEGQNGIRDIVISNNIILDQLSISSVSSGTPQTSYVGIQVLDTTPRGAAVTNNVIPGDYNSTTGAFVLPYDYDQQDFQSVASPVPYSNGLVVSNNILRRTRPAVTNFSDYGYGKRLFQGVPYNPAISNADLRGNIGINIGVSRNVSINNNVIASNYSRGIAINATTIRRAVDIIVSSNIIFDIFGFGFLTESSVNGQNIVVNNNLFDCDPYRLSSNSNMDGTYIANDIPIAVSLQNAAGVKVFNNTFKNCCAAVINNFQSILKDNILVCEPVVNGFSTSNIGIGVVQAASGEYCYEIVDSDPTSATYGTVTNVQLTQFSSIPTAGTYVRGAFVRNTNISIDANSMVVFGWLRLTTGSGHVVSTDWALVQTSNVSPAV